MLPFPCRLNTFQRRGLRHPQVRRRLAKVYFWLRMAVSGQENLYQNVYIYTHYVVWICLTVEIACWRKPNDIDPSCLHVKLASPTRSFPASQWAQLHLVSISCCLMCSGTLGLWEWTSLKHKALGHSTSPKRPTSVRSWLETYSAQQCHRNTEDSWSSLE